MINKSSKTKHTYFIPDFNMHIFSLTLSSVMLTEDLLETLFNKLSQSFTIPILLRWFSYKHPMIKCIYQGHHFFLILCISQDLIREADHKNWSQIRERTDI